MAMSPARTMGVIQAGGVAGGAAAGGVAARGGIVAPGGMIRGGVVAGGAAGGVVGVPPPPRPFVGEVCGIGGCMGCKAGCNGEVEETAVLSYVGCGGDWQAETTYKYVGNGAGNFDMVMVPTKWPSSAWFLVVALVAAIVVLWKGTETTTTTPPSPPKICTVFGDPHASTFDGAHADYYTPGEYWLVKSETIWIQGKYDSCPITHGLAVTKKIAIGGALMQGHTLIIGSLDATFDGVAIMQTFPASENLAGGLVKIEYNANGEVLQRGRDGKPLHVVHVSFSFGLQIQINRWNEKGEGDYINVKITMSYQKGMDGQCGNFNGNPVDDERTAVRARVGPDGVPQQDLLFPGPKTPINPGKRKTIADCPQKILDNAKNVCENREHTSFPSVPCLFDVCFGGEMFAREDNM